MAAYSRCYIGSIEVIDNQTATAKVNKGGTYTVSVKLIGGSLGDNWKGGNSNSGIHVKAYNGSTLLSDTFLRDGLTRSGNTLSQSYTVPATATQLVFTSLIYGNDWDGSWASFLTYGGYVNTQAGGTVKYYTGSEWKTCTVHYYTGSEWKQVQPQYYTGSEWKACSH